MKNGIALFAMSTAMLSACTSGVEYNRTPLTVETETVRTSDFVNSKSYVGTIVEDESISVSFTGMGTIKRVLVSEGQSVTEGQLLAEMDDSQARNMLEMAQVTCHQAEDAIARYRQLYDKGSLPEAKWIEAQSNLEQMRVAVKSAEKNLADCRLLSPVSGIVGVKNMNAGMTALPSQPVLTIYQINKVKVKVAIPECEIAFITPQTHSHISVAAARVNAEGGRIEKGIIADALTHTYNINILMPNADHRLLPGMVCNVELGTGESNSLSLPVRCVQQSVDGSHFVWIVEGDKVASRSVSLGKLNGNRIEITSGLFAGDKVITSGFQKVSNGDVVITK